MQLEPLIALLQTALVPVVLCSTAGLLCLFVQNRYGRIVDRIRALSEDPKPGEATAIQLEILLRRARYLKWSLFSLFFAISCFVTFSVLVFFAFTTGLPMQIEVLVTIFSVGMGVLLAGVWLEVIEIWNSFKTIHLEFDAYKERMESSRSSRRKNPKE
jgi:hypothetical protein